MSEKDWTTTYVVWIDEGKPAGHGALPKWKAEQLVKGAPQWQIVPKEEHDRAKAQIDERVQ